MRLRPQQLELPSSGERGEARGRDERSSAARPERRGKPPSPLRARVASALRDALPIGILGVALIGVPVLVLEPQGLPRLRSLERDVEQVEAENHQLEREITRLRSQVRLLKDDLGAIERVARTEFGLVRKSEIVLQLPK